MLLEELRIDYHSRMHGSIPSTLTLPPRLKKLNLDGNQLSGAVPAGKCAAPAFYWVGGAKWLRTSLAEGASRTACKPDGQATASMHLTASACRRYEREQQSYTALKWCVLPWRHSAGVPCLLQGCHCRTPWSISSVSGGRASEPMHSAPLAGCFVHMP